MTTTARSLILGLLIFSASRAPVDAQTLPPLPHCQACGGRLGVGVQFTTDHPRSSDVGSDAVPSPFLWFGANDGLSPTFGLNWLTVNVKATPLTGVTTIADVRVRPIMGGVSYTKVVRGSSVSVSAVGGWSFNSLHRITATSDGRAALTYETIMRDSPVAKLEVTGLQKITARTKFKASAGYLYVVRSSEIDVRTPDAQSRVRLPLSNLRFQVGMLYVLF